jgi:hypothetical protein
MTGWLRRAGTGTLADGTTVVWSVAEGRRGRRWREVRTGPEGVISSLLLETDPQRRFAHIELATAAGLLTLHPEADGTLHGNIVAADGIRHVVGRAWAATAVLDVEGSAIAASAAAWSGGRAADGFAEEHVDRSVTVTLRLDLADGRPGTDSVAIDDDGLPLLAGGTSWSLEDREA